MDEPTLGVGTDREARSARIEDLIDELKEKLRHLRSWTHNMQQAAAPSPSGTAYFHLGDLVEIGPTDLIFTNPRQPPSPKDYITGRFGLGPAGRFDQESWSFGPAAAKCVPRHAKLNDLRHSGMRPSMPRPRRKARRHSESENFFGERDG